MKFFVSFLMALLLSFSASAQSDIDISSFLKVKWQEPVEQIHQKFNTVVAEDGSHVSYHYDEMTQTTIVFEFKDQKLSQVMFVTHLKVVDSQEIIRFCDYLASNIIRKFGEPKQTVGRAGELILSWTGKDTVAFMACKTTVPGGPVLLLQQSKLSP